MQTGDAHSLPPANPRSLHSFVISRLLCKWTIGVTFALSLLLDPDPGGAVSICAWFFFFFFTAQWLSIPSSHNLFYFTNKFCVIFCVSFYRENSVLFFHQASLCSVGLENHAEDQFSHSCVVV